MLELEKHTLNVKVFGNEYSLKYPNLGQTSELVNSGENTDSVIKVLCELGLPEDVARQLEVSHLEALGKAFHEKKN